ncbi:hypothetical protein ASPCAL02030 [Aspergillus calidoustus]|uniref:Uncharacterized protein n=1 Tax=Aspergillus calidoustus TaxID=454130 RepID=A0A0U5CM31_ASPCI|nr:hypothetical protein ASPCAL02030 [Aspergillus calidoustus]
MAKVDAADGESASFPAPLYGGPVEARSLSSITSIASNPPAYPRNPTQKKLEPLVLYIVRVPGSKDVFLTPLKPPTKYSVSAEAINASLYYLHVAGPDDDILLQEYEQEREEQARLRKEGLMEDPDLPLPAPEIARLNNVRRKPVGAPNETVSLDAPPLPTRPSFSSDQQFENTAPISLDDSIPPPMLPPRPTLPDYSASGLPRGEETPPPLPQRPVSSIPQNETVFDTYRPPKKNNRWSALSGYVSNQVQRGRERYEAASPVRHSFDGARPLMRPQSSHDLPPPYSAIAPPPISPGQSPSRLPRDNAPPQQPGFHITLIRRDPTHGSQWNVATMSTPPSRTDGTGVDIDILTPGYSRFSGHNEPLSLESLGLNLSAEARSLLSRQQHTSSPSATPHDPSVPRDTSRPRRFHRKLLVSRPEESRGSLDLPGSRPSLDGGPGSPSNFSKLKSGYYTFTSPWNGTCTFSTSVNGRSLKCKHMIPSPGFPHSPNSTQENPAVTVAEIRFNTPFQGSHAHHHHSEHADPSGPYYYNPSTNPSKRAAIANFINHKFDRRGSNSSTSSAGANEPPPPLPRRPIDEDRIDLSLAREKAGGGMRGNSAKLGKLIIEDEGIKMLDLVVAACMTVWWKGYYY